MLTDYRSVIVVTIQLSSLEVQTLRAFATSQGLGFIEFIERFAQVRDSEAFFCEGANIITAQCPVVSSVSFSAGIRRILENNID